jgi:hypothetical protein
LVAQASRLCQEIRAFRTGETPVPPFIRDLASKSMYKPSLYQNNCSNRDRIKQATAPLRHAVCHVLAGSAVATSFAAAALTVKCA